MDGKQKTFIFLFVVLLLSLPFSKAIANIATYLLVAFSLLRLHETNFKELFFKYSHILGLVLIFLIYLAGILYSTDLERGWSFIRGHQRFLLLPFIVLINKDYIVDRFKSLIAWYCGGMAAASAFTLGFYFMPENTVVYLTNTLGFLREYEYSVHRTKFGLYNPFQARIQMSNLLAIASLGTLYLFFNSSRRLVFGGMFFLILITNIMLGGRGGQLGMFAGLIVFGSLLLYFRYFPLMKKSLGKWRSIGVLLSSVFTGAVLLPLLIYQTVTPVQERYDLMIQEAHEFFDADHSEVNYKHKTAARRLISWINHWEAIKENFWIGVGPGDYRNTLEKTYKESPFDINPNAHSQYLQIWLTSGIGALLIFFWVIFFWVRKSYSSGYTYIFAVSFIVFYLVSMIPDAILLRQVDNMAFSLFFSILGLSSDVDAPDKGK